MKKHARTLPEDNDRPSKKAATVPSWLGTAPDQYDKQFPYFRAPSELGSFSLDGERRFRHDSSQLRAFCPPANWASCALDLGRGYKDMIQRDESIKEYIDDLLRWIMCNKQKFLLDSKSRAGSTTGADGDGSRAGSRTETNGPRLATADVPRQESNRNIFTSLNTDFVCWRGLLTRILCIPYENQEDLLVSVIRFRGTYFMCEIDTEAKKRRNLEETPRQKEMCAWGLKFEQYVTAGPNLSVPDTESPVNTKIAYCSVARSRLSIHSIVFGAEVDCEDVDCQTGNRYIELKTSRLIEAKRQHENFCKFKLIKWWAQSFLIGIPRIVCGFRDDAGVVRSLQNYPVSEIPTMVQSSVYKPWKPTVCFNFLDAFLQFVKSNISTDNERCVYLFGWQPGSQMTCQKRGDDPQHNFLPDWFTKWEDWDQPISPDVNLPS